MTPRIPENISETIFDVIIVGAGINGAGIARDAAMRELRVLVLDKGDFGGGTTSWSTRLIHGGLRYLEHAELGLVRESLRERETLLRLAPHLVKPLPILLPLYQHAARGPLMIRMGMIAYDLLSLGKSLPRHRMLTPDEALLEAPGVNSDALRAAASYYDAQVEFAERLVLENVLSAKKLGATLINYARVQKLKRKDGDRIVELVDTRSGAVLTARGRIVVNAAGPWVDDVLKNAVCPSRRLIGGTKGSHIIVNSFPGAPSMAIYVEAESDKRPFFIIPWNGKYLIGTTDTRFTGDLDQVEIEDDEIDYLLRETNTVISSARLTRDEVLFTYAGVRPLPYTENKNEEGITRRHFIRESKDDEGILSIVGGKLTTYRSLAEEVVNLIGRKLGKNLGKCSTAVATLPGAETDDFHSFSKGFKRESGLSRLTGEHLLRVYGTRATEVLEVAVADESLGEIFDEETGAIAAEVVFSFQPELAETLADCLLRRTMVGLNSSLGIGADERAAAIAKKYLSWSDARVHEEVSAYRSYVKRFQPCSIRNRDQ